MFGSPPPWRAAMMMARLSLLKSLPRLASIAPFLCLIVAQWEWPDMGSLLPARCRAGAAGVIGVLPARGDRVGASARDTIGRASAARLYRRGAALSARPGVP